MQSTSKPDRPQALINILAYPSDLWKAAIYSKLQRTGRALLPRNVVVTSMMTFFKIQPSSNTEYKTLTLQKFAFLACKVDPSKPKQFVLSAEDVKHLLDLLQQIEKLRPALTLTKKQMLFFDTHKFFCQDFATALLAIIKPESINISHPAIKVLKDSEDKQLILVKAALNYQLITIISKNTETVITLSDYEADYSILDKFVDAFAIPELTIEEVNSAVTKKPLPL